MKGVLASQEQNLALMTKTGLSQGMQVGMTMAIDELRKKSRKLKLRSN